MIVNSSMLLSWERMDICKSLPVWIEMSRLECDAKLTEDVQLSRLNERCEVTAGEGCVSLGSAKIGSNRHSAEFFLVYSCLFVLYVR